MSIYRKSTYNNLNKRGKQSMPLWSIILLCILAFLFFVGIGVGVFYFAGLMKSKQKYVQINQPLEKGKAYLIAETNFPSNAKACYNGDTYGLDDNGNFYVNNGCSGVFLYHDNNNRTHIGICSTHNTVDKSCDMKKMTQSIPPVPFVQATTDINPFLILPSVESKQSKSWLNGFIPKLDKNIIITEQNGNCSSKNYGFYGNNKIFTSGGCSGIFQIGPLVGKCGNKEDTQTNCPIGKIEIISGEAMGLVPTVLTPQDHNLDCRENGDHYGYKDRITGFRDTNMCTGGLTYRALRNKERSYVDDQFKIPCNPKISDCKLAAGESPVKSM